MVSDFDSTFPVEQDELFPSQRIVTDSVKWQSSQLSSCAALNSLILEIPARRKIVHDTSWYNQEASTSASSQPVGAGNHRPLVRSNSRARFGRLSGPGTHPPPDLNLFNKKDPMQFLNLLKGVSERVDENAGLRSARGGDMGGVKRKTRTSVPGEVHAKARGNKPTYKSEGQNKASRIKGKQRADGGGDTEYESQSPDGTHRSLPNLSSSTSTTASSSSFHSINTSISGDVDVSMSMDNMVDVDESDQRILPFSMKRHPGSHPYPPPSESISVRASPDPPTAPHKITPEPRPRLHPLLSQQKPRLQKQPPPKPQFCPPAPSQRAPCMSQTSNPPRMPTLGMRRTASTPATTSAHHALPTRQKGFKPPLLPGTQPRPQQPKLPAQPAVKATPVTPAVPLGRPQGGGGKFTRPSAASNSARDKNHSHPRAVSPEPDPDSSFGDMSFDMDVDALEETMRMYD